MIIKLALATLLSALTLPALAAQCDISIEANDAMQFNVKEITVDKTCKEFTVNLKHVGKLPKAAMGHNWVLTKEADMKPTATDGMAAGLSNNYIKPNDARVIAATKIIGGGESTSVTFDTSKLAAGQNYEFFCSFPGHDSIMKGPLKLSS